MSWTDRTEGPQVVDEQTDAVEAAVAGELRLLDPGVRASERLLSELLHPEFTEIGASGRLWTRAEIIASLVEGAPESDRPIEVTEMRGRLLAPDVVHLTYVSTGAGRRARRSSVWCRTGEGRRLYFHQGTPSTD